MLHLPCLTLDASLSRASGMKCGANSGVAVNVASSASTSVSRVMLNLSSRLHDASNSNRSFMVCALGSTETLSWCQAARRHNR